MHNSKNIFEVKRALQTELLNLGLIKAYIPLKTTEKVTQPDISVWNYRGPVFGPFWVVSHIKRFWLREHNFPFHVRLEIELLKNIVQKTRSNITYLKILLQIAWLDITAWSLGTLMKALL